MFADLGKLTLTLGVVSEVDMMNLVLKLASALCGSAVFDTHFYCTDLLVKTLGTELNALWISCLCPRGETGLEAVYENMYYYWKRKGEKRDGGVERERESKMCCNRWARRSVVSRRITAPGCRKYRSEILQRTWRTGCNHNIYMHFTDKRRWAQS